MFSLRATSLTAADIFFSLTHPTKPAGRTSLRPDVKIPQRCVDLQGFAQHLSSGVLQEVAAQVHLPQAGVGAQSVDQYCAPLAELGVGQ